MPQINWRRLLDASGVEYVEKGPSVARGNIAVHCPFCGASDPSHHLGISLTTGAWGCWRNKQHRGRSPLRLLIHLLGVSYDRAREIAGLDDGYMDPEGYESVKHDLFRRNRAAIPAAKTELDFPAEFFPIAAGRTRAARFIRYLTESRGFRAGDVADLCSKYHLMAAVSGDFSNRIIIPYYVGAHAVTWTGRGIGPASLRYLDLSVADSIVPPKKTLYNYNATARGGRVLLVVEGPFDSLKMDYYGSEHGVRAVALSTNGMTAEQSLILEEVSQKFDRVLVMMDNASSLGVLDSIKMKEELSHIRNIGFAQLPHGYKDGGEMLPGAITTFCKELLL